MNDCLTESIQDGILIMSEGIPDLGVPPVDPYHQDEIRVEYKNNQVSQEQPVSVESCLLYACLTYVHNPIYST